MFIFRKYIVALFILFIFVSNTYAFEVGDIVEFTSPKAPTPIAIILKRVSTTSNKALLIGMRENNEFITFFWPTNELVASSVQPSFLNKFDQNDVMVFFNLYRGKKIFNGHKMFSGSPYCLPFPNFLSDKAHDFFVNLINQKKNKLDTPYHGEVVHLKQLHWIKELDLLKKSSPSEYISQISEIFESQWKIFDYISKNKNNDNAVFAEELYLDYTLDYFTFDSSGNIKARSTLFKSMQSKFAQYQGAKIKLASFNRFVDMIENDYNQFRILFPSIDVLDSKGNLNFTQKEFFVNRGASRILVLANLVRKVHRTELHDIVGIIGHNQKKLSNLYESKNGQKDQTLKKLERLNQYYRLNIRNNIAHLRVKEYLQKHPGKKIFLIYGAAHIFTEIIDDKNIEFSWI